MKNFLFSFFISILSLNLSATHFIGGEITWECNKDVLSPDYGKYTFFLTIYQDCDGIDFSFFSEDIIVHNNPTTTLITCNWISTNDISATGFSAAQPCYNCDNQPFGEFGAVKQWNYSSGPITLNGTPPLEGWHFIWGSCCRSSQLTQGMNDDDWTIRSVMYPYTDPSGVILPNGNTCHDNSPIFKEEPKSILCATGDPFSYSHLAFDVDLDSISYSWAEPLGDSFSYDPNNPNSIALLFTAPYTVNSPIPGNPTLNNENGEISFLTLGVGVFVTCVKVESYKCGQLVAEVYRDVNVALKSCATLPNGAQNSAPIISAPSGSQNWITSLNPSTGLPSYSTTVMAGELVSFSVTATDLDINSSGSMQDVSLEVEGGQLDPLLALSNLATFTVTSSSPGNVSGDFLWQSNCDHMQDYGCGRKGGAYTFNLKAYDDFCPENGIKIATITINVIPPQPDLRCLYVDENGGVDLFFSFPNGVVDTNISYDIYYSKNIGGPYALIDSVFYPDTTYYHATSVADVSNSYYYLLGSVTCGTNLGSSDSLLYSDTLTTILMNATVINLGLTVDLAWNAIHSPLLTSSSTDYQLHYINANNSDDIIATTPDLFFQMDGDDCDYFPSFYVDIHDLSGCFSRSSIATVHLEDTISPMTPIIKDVSVDNTGKATVNWQTSLGADLYIIYFRAENGVWSTLDTVSSFFNSYTYQQSDASNYIEEFSIRAIDTCGNARARSLTHNSILLKNTSDVCDYSISLAWNDYINWEGGVHHYNILVSEMISDGNIFDTTIRIQGETKCVINDISSLSYYNIVIEAYNSDSTLKAVSNNLDLNITFANKPLFNYIEYATVNHNDGSVDISCLVDISAVIDRYDVYRSIEENNDFSKIGEISFSSSSPINFNDKNVQSDDNFYQYEIYPVDTCGETLIIPSYNSPVYFNDTSFAQTILLKSKINIDYSEFSYLDGQYTNTLFFNEYSKWLGDVSEYRLYRSINSEPFNLLPIYVWDRVSFPEEELSYIDVVTEYGDGNGRFCYYIEAVEGSSNPYGSTTQGSFSNISCVSQTPIIFIPNTFTPNKDEHNEVFRPITYFVSEEGYSFSIYNRQGAKLFETNNPQKGWDGSYNETQVQNGSYIYHLQFLNGIGVLVEKTDVINLVR